MPLPKVQRDSFHIAQRLRASAKDGTELTKQELLLAAEFIEAAYTVYLPDENEEGGDDATI